ncbi:hypothetical protein GQ457_05G027580 [Hibiscus cannabinus]
MICIPRFHNKDKSTHLHDIKAMNTEDRLKTLEANHKNTQKMLDKIENDLKDEIIEDQKSFQEEVISSKMKVQVHLGGLSTNIPTELKVNHGTWSKFNLDEIANGAKGSQSMICIPGFHNKDKSTHLHDIKAMNTEDRLKTLEANHKNTQTMLDKIENDLKDEIIEAQKWFQEEVISSKTKVQVHLGGLSANIPTELKVNHGTWSKFNLDGIANGAKSQKVQLHLRMNQRREQLMRIPKPALSKCTKVQVKETLGKGIGIGRSFGKQYQWRLFPITIAEKKDQFGLGFNPGALQIRLEIKKRFVNPDATRVKKEGKNDLDKMLEGLDINDVTCGRRKQIHVQFSDINGINNYELDLQLDFGQPMCSKEIENYDKEECELPNDLLMLIENKEKQILPHKEELEILNLGTEDERREVKIGNIITAKTR